MYFTATVKAIIIKTGTNKSRNGVTFVNFFMIDEPTLVSQFNSI